MLDIVPSKSVMIELLGQSLFEVWQDLCLAVGDSAPPVWSQYISVTHLLETEPETIEISSDTSEPIVIRIIGIYSDTVFYSTIVPIARKLIVYSLDIS